LASKKRKLFIGSKKIARHIEMKVIFIPNGRAFIILKRKLQQASGSRAVPSSACPASSRQERTCQQFGADKGASPCCLQGRDSGYFVTGRGKGRQNFARSFRNDVHIHSEAKSISLN